VTIGFEEVGRHARAVADVVTDVIGDHRGIARIVFGNTGFYFSDEIGTDVGGFGEDAAAQTCEDRDERTPEGEPDERAE